VAISGTPYSAQKVAFYAVIACWLLLALTFWMKKRPNKIKEAKRDHTSHLGLGLQSLAYFLVWFDPLRRKVFTPGVVASQVLGRGVAFLAIGSVWLVRVAARHLGKQWALAARLVEGHELIQDGPYHVVRTPFIPAAQNAAGDWIGGGSMECAGDCSRCLSCRNLHPYSKRRTSAAAGLWREIRHIKEKSASFDPRSVLSC